MAWQKKKNRRQAELARMSSPVLIFVTCIPCLAPVLQSKHGGVWEIFRTGYSRIPHSRSHRWLEANLAPKEHFHHIPVVTMYFLRKGRFVPDAQICAHAAFLPSRPGSSRSILSTSLYLSLHLRPTRFILHPGKIDTPYPCNSHSSSIYGQLCHTQDYPTTLLPVRRMSDDVSHEFLHL
jgi:hypothetical protein